MTLVLVLAGLMWLVSSLLHISSMALVARRIMRASQPAAARTNPGLVSLVRPVCGVDPHIVTALKSGFLLDDRTYELIFCAHASDDEIVPVVRRLMSEYPSIPSKLLFGDTLNSGNPKLNNIAKSWPEIEGEWVVFCDDNVVLPANYLAQLFDAWGPDTGVVSSIHVGTQPSGFWAEVECAFLNAYHARWHIFATVMNHGFAHGKTMMLRRSDLASFGGIDALAGEIAEDVVVTKLVRARGLTVSSMATPVVQPVGNRTGRDVFDRQSRWARLRRTCYPLSFVPELLSGGLLPVVAVAILALATGFPVVYAVVGQVVFWYGAEIVFLAAAGWHWTWRTIPASIVRDMAIPVIWLTAWRNGDFKWRERHMQTNPVSMPK